MHFDNSLSAELSETENKWNMFCATTIVLFYNKEEMSKHVASEKQLKFIYWANKIE